MKDNHHLRRYLRRARVDVQDYIKANNPDVARWILDKAGTEFATEILFDLLVSTLNDSEAFRVIELANAKECSALVVCGEVCAEANGEDSVIATCLPMLRAHLEKLTLQRLPQAKAETKQTAKRL